MSFARPVPSKSNGISTAMPPLPTLPKLPSRLQPKRYIYLFHQPYFIFFVIRPSLIPTAVKKEKKNDTQLSPVPNQNDLKEIVK
jgi:hypothetical protein